MRADYQLTPKTKTECEYVSVTSGIQDSDTIYTVDTVKRYNLTATKN